MIAITGATGALNGATADHLLDTLDAADLRIVARDPARAGRFADRGVSVRPGDYADLDGLRDAFDGADTVLLVSSNDPTADAVAMHRNAIAAAVAAGVEHVFYTSHQGAAPVSPFHPARDHAATEDLLASSGLRWTSLRNGFYAHSVGWLLGPWSATGVVTVPADGPVSWTSREDAAEAAARLLLDPPAENGPVTLTATAAPRFADLAAMLGEITGREIGFEVVGSEAWLRTAVAAGAPEGQARFTVGMYEAAGLGLFAGTAPDLRRLLGREPRTAREALADAVAHSA